MVCSHRCIPVVITIDGAPYDVDVDAIISLRFVSHGVIFLPLDSLVLFDLCKISLRPKFQRELRTQGLVTNYFDPLVPAPCQSGPN